MVSQVLLVPYMNQKYKHGHKITVLKYEDHEKLKLKLKLKHGNLF